MRTRRVLTGLFALLLTTAAYSQTITTGTVSPASYCANGAINVPFTTSAPFGAGNIYSLELSSAGGTFPGTVIGTLSSTGTSGTVAGVIPSTTTGSAAYRVRVNASNPVVTGAQSATTITVVALGINTPTFAGTSFCQGATFNVANSVATGCPFPNTPAANVFTAELSDAFGSFAAPTTIGSVTFAGNGNISVTIPTTAGGGTAYRIRVRSSNPGGGLTSPQSVAFTVTSIGMNAPTTAATTFCAGSTFNVTRVMATACNYLAGNVFTAQLSDASGSFASPLAIGTATATGAGNISVTIPSTTTSSTLYRIRVVSTNPVTTSLPTASSLTVNQLGINAPTVSTTSLCQGAAISVTYTVQNSCTFPNTPSNNVFTAQLSNAAGSFASPTAIGTLTSNNSGTINAVVPPATPAGTNYRVRVVSSNPTVIVSADNGANITVSATSGNPATFGTTAWNAAVYSGTNATITNNVFLGSYTENTLNFNTTSRWNSATGPGVADGTTGSAYAGCAVPATNYSMSFKRTNFTCGYYQINIPTHDDDMRIFLDGVNIFTHVGCCDAHTSVWTGFLGTTSQLDIQFINFGGPGNLQVSIVAAANPLTVSPATTICNTASTTLSVTSPLTLSYAWTPTTGLTPADGLGATVTAQPASTTTYTVTGTDATTGCTVTRTVPVTVVSAAAVPTIAVTNSTPTICSGITATTLTASGANTYSWSPSTGLSFTTGNTVIADPPSTTTYTVTGNTGCQTGTQTATVTVQVRPSSPTTTTFGSGVWNAFVYNDMALSNFYGYYTENSLGFNTATRWATGSGPSVANSASGLAYNGCSINNVTNFSMSFKRTNFTCGYYQLNVNYQDDNFVMLVDGVQVFARNGSTGIVLSNAWSGFLGPTSTVELQLVNTGGAGRLEIGMAVVSAPQVLSPNVTICTGTSTDLTATATAYPSATYGWSISPTHPSITFSPGVNVANTTLQTTGATPSGNYTLTNTITDAGATGCTATRTTTVTVNATPNTQVTPTSATLTCPTASVTLTATGANTYTWSPTTGLTPASGIGHTVVAQPTTTTTYTVTGNNNCSSNTASVTVTVIPLPDYNTFPTGVWNFYGFNSQTIGTNYQGYYTDNGTGTPAYSFNTGTRWGSGLAPSVAIATNGAAWSGCTMNTGNISLSGKRTGFACGVYQIDVPAHDDDFLLFINGVQVAQHVGCCDAHTNVWTGILNAASTVEFQMKQGGGGSYLAATFTSIAQPAAQRTWIGAVSNDWFTAGNWCGGGVPTATLDALIPAAGPQNMPLINANGATVRNITINPAIAAGTYNNAIAAASLTMNTFNLDVNGNWVGNGVLNPNGGTVSFVGTGAGNTISGTGTSAFNNLIINKSNNITISGGTHTVAGTMTFTNGIVTQNGTLRFLAGSSAAGASNTSYVDGVVTKVGNTAFTFPVGKGGLYRLIGISAPSTATDSYTAQYFNTSALGTYPNGNRDAALSHVSAAEYWMLNRTAGTSAVNVTLSWNTNSGGVGSLADLRVAGWNGSFWANLGNTTPTGNTTSGTVTSSLTSTTSGPYTLSTTTTANSLPIVLADLNCGINSFGNPEISWATVTEINADRFEVERSANGKNFKTVGNVIAKGNSRSRQEYSFEDLNAPMGKVYYRLKQTDRDGKATYFETCALEVEDAGGLAIFPNPATATASVKLRGGDLQELSVVNSVGQRLNVGYTVKDSVVEIDLSGLAPGVYMVRISTNEKSGLLRLVKS